MTRVVLAFLFTLSVTACQAETRWCAITGAGAHDTVSYAPIAKAARQAGVFVGKILFAPNGRVVEVERIFGPPMLAHFSINQLKNWKLETPAIGDALCESLVIVDYRLIDPGNSDKPTVIEFESGMLRATVVASPAIPTTNYSVSGRKI
jgi:hypothetical protein